MRKKITATFIAVSIALAAVLLVIPGTEKVQASNPTKDHGQQGTLKSDRTDSRSHTGLGCSPWDPRC